MASMAGSGYVRENAVKRALTISVLWAKQKFILLNDSRPAMWEFLHKYP